MKVLHLRQGQSPRDAFEEFGSAQPQTRQNEAKISMAAMVASCGWVSQSYMHQVHRSTLSTSNCPLGYPSATLRAHRDCFSYGNKGDCPGWWSPPSSVYLLPAGMNMSPVSRLKKTWAKVKTAKFFILEVNQDCWFMGCGHLAPEWSYSNVSLSPSSTRWTQQGISATTGQLCVGRPTARSLLTAAGRR